MPAGQRHAVGGVEAGGVAGVAAKLRLLVKKTEDGGPVELARSALADVERLGAAGAPAPPRNGADVRPRTRQK